MYEKQFGLEEAPFSSLPDTSYLVAFPQHTNASKRLEYSLETSEGFTLLTGETGCGKTTLLRELQEKLGESILSGFIADTLRLEGNVIERILFSLGLEIESEDWTSKFKQLTEFLIEKYAQNQRVVIFFDEAQNLSLGCFEELRVLSNINSGKNRLLQFILAGTPELRSALAKPAYNKLTQRIDNAYHLLPLTSKETIHYIYQRLAIAGAKKESIFTQEACELIYRASGGIPRIINQLCHTSLVYAYGMNTTKVSVAVVKVVLTDRVYSWSASSMDAIAQHQHNHNGEVNNTEPCHSVETEISGLYFHTVNSKFETTFPQTHKASPHESSWLAVIDPSDRDRVNKVFKHYLELGNHHFELSTKVVTSLNNANNAQDIPAHLIFDKGADHALPRYTLTVQVCHETSPTI